MSKLANNLALKKAASDTHMGGISEFLKPLKGSRLLRNTRAWKRDFSDTIKRGGYDRWRIDLHNPQGGLGGWCAHEHILDVTATMGYDDGMAKRFSDQIRQAVDASGMTRYRICKLTGIDQAMMSRFMAGRGMELANIDRLAELLGLSVKRPAKRQARKAR